LINFDFFLEKINKPGTSFFQFFKRLLATVDKSSLAMIRRKLLTVFPMPVF
jgi:hypothetical protein